MSRRHDSESQEPDEAREDSLESANPESERAWQEDAPGRWRFGTPTEGPHDDPETLPPSHETDPDAPDGHLVAQSAGAGGRILSRDQFKRLTDVPAAMIWLANIDNPNTRRAYQADLEAFIGFCGIETPHELRDVTRAHIIAWRGQLEGFGLAPTTIRRKLSAISSLYDFLCNENAVESNPVAGVKRPPADGNEGKTPALSDEQARKLLQAPTGNKLKAVRDRAILAVYLFHALRRSESRHLRSAVCRSVVESPTYGCKAKAPRRATCQCIRLHSQRSTNTSSPAGTGRIARVRCSGRCGTRAANLAARLRVTGSTKCSRGTRSGQVYTSMGYACTRYERPQLRTRSSTRPTSPSCRTGSATPTSALHGSTTKDGRDPRTRRRFGYNTRPYLM